MIPLFLLSLLACGEEAVAPSDDRPADIPDARATRVEAVVLQRGDARVELDLPGEVGGARDATLAAANGGFVESVRVDEGDNVRAGQTLVRVDTSLYSAQLEQAEAQLEQAEADLRRLQALGDMAAESQLQGTRTQQRIASANLKQAQTRLSRSVIKAPFAGVVATVNVEPGESAPPGSPVARVVQIDPAIVTLSVSDRDIVALKPGMPVTVSIAAQSGQREGHIAHVSPAADLRTRAFPVEVEVENADAQLLPGMIARVRASRALAEDAMVIPQDWLVTRRDARGVFVADGETAEWRNVVLGEVIHDQVVVREGLQLGDRIIITGHRELVDGDPLIISREGTCCSDGRPVWDEG